MTTHEESPGDWLDGDLPGNVRLGTGTTIRSEFSFKRLYSTRQPALVVGDHGTMDGVQFAIGESGQVVVGDYCYFDDAVLLAEEEIVIGSCVLIGWNATIADTDFHPVTPAKRVEDAIACSPLGGDATRPRVETAPVVIEDDVWIGPCAVVLKGVHVGRGAFVEPGSVVTRDVPGRARVLGNPARVVEQL